ncbi:MAG: cobalt-precorrin-5B (C(1))-methyltransferase [Methylococcales bacterium]|nr:cobalt-precorrin-5B (C(1))-methyltransferase [Methylococcales bacterium]
MEKKVKGTRKGYTTGACSAAATRAAVLGLINGSVPDSIECDLPNGQKVTFAITESGFDGVTAYAVVIKDAGDDPDVTDKAALTAHVRLLPNDLGQIMLCGGEGVGTITMQGLGLEVNGPAINPVPRRNIKANVESVASEVLKSAGIEVTISVPGGEQIAKKTLNHRLGIMGGVSILGTTGIVHPYSTAAFRASVIQGIEVAANQGQSVVVLTTGGRTEKFTMKELPQLAQASFVQMGDFLKYALDTVVKCEIPQVVIGGMVGKLTKIAQGETITHANRNAVNTGLLAEIATDIGVSDEICAEIRQSTMARYASERMEELGLINPFYQALGQRVIETLQTRYEGKFHLRVLMCDFDGNKLAEVEGEV